MQPGPESNTEDLKNAFEKLMITPATNAEQEQIYDQAGILLCKLVTERHTCATWWFDFHAKNFSDTHLEQTFALAMAIPDFPFAIHLLKHRPTAISQEAKITFFQRAVDNRKLEYVIFALENFEIPPDVQTNALSKTLYTNNTQIVECLIMHGAKPTERDLLYTKSQIVSLLASTNVRMMHTGSYRNFPNLASPFTHSASSVTLPRSYVPPERSTSRVSTPLTGRGSAILAHFKDVLPTADTTEPKEEETSTPPTKSNRPTKD